MAASTAEAMAAGLPVIITNVGNNDQWITDGQQGFNIPISDPVNLTEKILTLLKNKTLRQNMGAAGRQVIVERNNLFTEMMKVEALYTKLKK